MAVNKKVYWILWFLITIGLAAYLTIQLTGEQKQVFLPGKTSHGHYQIEMACTACHSEPLGGGAVLQDACMSCHGEELAIADDSHPKTKFTNPRNADRVAVLDARQCITCHTEHREEITMEMGVTLPNDFCFKCHQDVAENRPSHQGMEFSTCASAGCHNFHDNRALYEDFLAKHLDEPFIKESAQLPQLSMLDAYQSLDTYPVTRYPVVSLGIEEADQPEIAGNHPEILQDWLATSHSQAGVNCTACHEQKPDATGKAIWVNKPDHKVCENCHKDQTKGFLSGKHGMRLAQGLTPMTPARARIDMKKTAHDKELSCISCHSAHRFDTRHASVDACLGCHDDSHSNNYKGTPHFNLWQKESEGKAQAGTGVSCATCHMPRKQLKREGKNLVVAEHNQNDNLRPNEKMLRSVCMQCHGLGFSIDALADRKLVEKNFSEKPAFHIESLDLVKKRLDLKKDVQGM